MKPDKLALIIVHYGNSTVTVNCINSISVPEDIKFKIIVMDNSGNFSLPERSNIATIKNKRNIGYPAAVNKGIDIAIKLNFRIFLVMNNDVILGENFISLILNAIKNKEEKIIVAPLILQNKRQKLIWFGGGKIQQLLLEGKHLGKNKTFGKYNCRLQPEFITFFSGALFLITFGAFQSIGHFREDFFLYYDDVDYSLRAERKNIPIIFNPYAVAFHLESVNTLNEHNLIKFKKVVYYYRIRNKIKLIKQYGSFPGKLIASLFLSVKYFKYLVGSFLTGEKLLRKIVIKGFFDGIKG